MEKTIEKTKLIIEQNEKIIANILHDIKSPLYSIKIGLQNHLEDELSRDIFETTLDVLEYIENFLVNYSFQEGKFENKIAPCDIKKIIDKKIENYKHIFINKDIHIDMILNDSEFIVNSIEIFLSSIIGNIISNIAFHGNCCQNAIIEVYKKDSYIFAEFKNTYSEKTDNFKLGLDFCAELSKALQIDMKFSRTKDTAFAKLKIPSLQSLKR